MTDAADRLPAVLTPVNHVEPSPRRVRAVLAGATVLDTTRASYVWEWPFYPRYYVPLADVDRSALVDEGTSERDDRGLARRHGLRSGDAYRAGAARVYGTDAAAGLVDTVRIEWDAVDAWFEEDEEVFVHPRNPYTRVDALRSTRSVRVELDGMVLAQTRSPVLVFETGLPTRFYLPRVDVDLSRLEPTGTVTECPYKGRTSTWWSVRTDDALHPDLAWAYDFPTAAMLPAAGMVCFYAELLDHVVDGVCLARPRTHFVG